MLGSTGNVYSCAVARLPTCECVDFRERHNICKHLLFVYHKVLRLADDSTIPLQRALLRTELREALAVVVDGGGGGAPAPTASAARVRRTRRARGDAPPGAEAAAEEGALVAPRPAAADEPCAICFDALDAEAAADVLDEALAAAAGTDEAAASAAPARHVATSHCARGCGRVFHASCLGRWFGARGEHRGRECPVCRCGWRADDPAVPVAEATAAADDGERRDEGYVNLGALQPGTQAARDDSSYSEWLELHRRRREQAALAPEGGGGSPAAPGGAVAVAGAVGAEAASRATRSSRR